MNGAVIGQHGLEGPEPVAAHGRQQQQHVHSVIAMHDPVTVVPVHIYCQSVGGAGRSSQVGPHAPQGGPNHVSTDQRTSLYKTKNRESPTDAGPHWGPELRNAELLGNNDEEDDAND